MGFKMPSMFADKKHPLWKEAESRNDIRTCAYDNHSFQYALVETKDAVAQSGSLSPGQVAECFVYHDVEDKAVFGSEFAYREGSINVLVLEDRVPDEFRDIIAIGEHARALTGDDRRAGAIKMYEEAEKRGEEFLRKFAQWQMQMDRKNMTTASPDLLERIRTTIKKHLPSVVHGIVDTVYK